MATTKTSNDADPQDPPTDTPPPDPAPTVAPGPPPADTLKAIEAERDAAKKELGRISAEYAKLQDAERERADAEKSALELAQDRVKELEARDVEREREAKATRLRERTVSTAARLGFADSDDAVDLLARRADEVEYDDAGAPRNLEALLASILEAKPYLKRDNSVQPPPGGQGSRPPVGAAEAAQQALQEGNVAASVALKNRQLAELKR